MVTCYSSVRKLIPWLALPVLESGDGGAGIRGERLASLWVAPDDGGSQSSVSKLRWSSVFSFYVWSQRGCGQELGWAALLGHGILFHNCVPLCQWVPPGTVWYIVSKGFFCPCSGQGSQNNHRSKVYHIKETLLLDVKRVYSKDIRETGFSSLHLAERGT